MKRLTECCFVVFFLVFSLFNITPFLQYNANTVLVGALFIVVFFLSFLLPQKTKKIDFPTLIIVLLISLQSILYWAIGFSTCSFGKALYRVMLVLLFLVIRNMTFLSSKSKNVIYFGVTVITLVNLIDNIRLNILYPNASEVINSVWGEQYFGMNVGNTLFTLYIALFSLFCFVNVFKRSHGVFWFICLLASLVYLYITGRALSIIAALLGISLLLLFFVFKKRNKAFFAFAVLMVLSLLTIVIISVDEAKLVSLLGARLAGRLMSIVRFLKFEGGASSSDTLSLRLDMYYMSLETGFSSITNFIIGIGEHPANITVLNRMGIGGHSSLIDLIPQYGIVHFVLMLVLIIRSGKYLISNQKTSVQRTSFGIVLTVFFLSMVVNNTLVIYCLLLVSVFVSCSNKIKTREKVNNFNLNKGTVTICEAQQIKQS